ncbi:MAG: hypothetical protein ACYDBV_06665 [Nitrospiria bacterium]
MKNKIVYILILFFLVLFKSHFVGGQPLESPADQNSENRDPFHLPHKKVLSRPSPGGVQVDRWSLTGILVGASGEKSAIINNRVVSEGDQVTGGTVSAIDSDRVILKGAFGTKEIRILPFLSDDQ